MNQKTNKYSRLISSSLLAFNLASCANLVNTSEITIQDYLVEKNSYYVLVEYLNDQWEIKEITLQPRARDNKNQEVLQITNQLTQISPFFEVRENKNRYHCQSLTKYEGYHPCSSSKLSRTDEENNTGQSYVSDITMNVLIFGTAPGYKTFSKDKPVSYINQNYSVVINEEAVQDILNETNLIETIKENKTLIALKKTVLASDFGSMPNNNEQPRNYANNVAPIVRLSEIDEEKNSSITRFKVTVNDQGGGIGKTHIYLDNTRLNPKIIETQTNVDGSTTTEYELDLPYGQSTIKAKAYDHTNKNISHPASYTLIKDYYSQPTLHVLSIGINNFEDARNLNYTVSDAKKFGKAIEEQSQGLFKEVSVHYLTETSNTSKEDIMNKLAHLKETVKPYDYFIFYGASHGIYDSKITKNYFFLPSDYDKTNIASGISQNELKNALMDIKTANKLIVLDTCHSGGIHSSFEDLEIHQSNIGKDLGISIISATKKEELSWERGLNVQGGLFTHFFVKALRNEGKLKDHVDKNKDSIIDSFEVFNVVKKYANYETKNNENAQHSSYFQSGRVFEIALLDKSKKPTQLQSKHFTTENITKLNKSSDENDTQAIIKLYQQHDEKIESLKGALKTEDKFKKKYIAKEQIDRIPFIFGEKYIFLGLKDAIKPNTPQLYYDKNVNRYLLYADFYSDTFVNHSNTYLDTPYIEKVDVGWHDVFYRVTMHLKPDMYKPDSMNYELIKANDGYFFNIK